MSKTIPCALTALTTLALTTSLASAVTYDGPATGSWNIPAHWDTGSVPSSTEPVLIDARAQNSTVELNINTTIGSLQIAIGDTLQLNNSFDLIVGPTTSVDNNGTIITQASSGTTVLNVQGFAIQGTGEIILNHPTVAQILTTDQVLLHDTAHTIRGAGQILNNTGGMNNLGSIIADSTSALTIDPNAQGFTQSDTATLQAQGTGGLTFDTGTFTLGQSTIDIFDGSKLTLSTNTEIIGGQFSTAGSGVILTENGNIFDAITLNTGARLNHLNVHDVTVRNGLTNNGTWQYQASSSSSITTFEGNQTITGTGDIVLNHPTIAVINTDGSTVTNAAGHTIRGTGNILSNVGSMINDGTIRADAASALTIDPDASGFTNSNAANLEATGTGGLTFAAGDFNLNSSTVNINNGSRLTLSPGTNIIGGTLQTSGSGHVITANTASLNAVTIAAGSLVNHLNVDDVDITNGLTNNGTWQFQASSSSSILNFIGSQTISGTGEIVLNHPSVAILRADAGSTITNDANHTIRGTGNLLNNTSGMLNLGTIIAQGPSALTIDPDATGFTTEGTLRAEGTGGIDFAEGEHTFVNTTLDILDGSRADALTNATLIDLDLAGSGTGTFHANNNSTFVRPTITSGTVNQPNVADATIQGGLTNHGTWHLDGFNVLTILIFDGSESIAGTGEITLSNSGVNAIRAATDVVITHGPDHTIRGAGNLLSNSSGMDNAGTIIAQGSIALVIDPSNLGFNNTGTLRAEGTGGLTLEDGLFTLNNTTTQVLDGSKITLASGAHLANGTLETLGSGQVITASSTTFEAMTIASGSVVNQGNGNQISIIDNLTNDGTWNMNGFNIPTTLQFSGATTTLSGTGEIILSNSTVNHIDAPGQTLTHDTNHTIRGAGNIGLNAGGVNNLGTIIAQGSGALTIDPDANGFSNTGTLTAEGSGGFIFADGTFELNATTIDVLNGSKLQTSTGTTIANGSLETLGTGQVITTTGTTFEAMTITPGSVVNQNNSNQVAIVDSLTNNGTWNVNGFNIPTTITLSGTSTSLTGDGEMVLSNTTLNQISAPGENLVNDTNHTIRGAGNLLLDNSGMTNNGTILAQGSNTLTINPDATGFSNLGTLRAEGTGGLVFGDGTFELNATSIDILDGSKLNTTAGTTIANGTLSTQGNGVINLETATTLDNITIDDGTLARIGNADTVTITNGLTNNGRLEVNGFNIPTTLSFDGSQTISGTGEIAYSNSSLNRLIASSGSTITNAAGHTISGVIPTFLANDAGMINHGTIIVTTTSGITIDPDANGFINTATGTMGGIGKFTMTDGTLDTDGTLSPGFDEDNRGTLNIIGDVNTSATSLLDLSLGQEAPANGSDRLIVDGNLDLDGTLDLTFVGGFAGTVSNPHRIVTADNIVGSFSSFTTNIGILESLLSIIQTATTIDVALDVLLGDANLDRTVDLIDLSILASNFGDPGPFSFTDGDFNFDGEVDLIDLSLLAGNFGVTAPLPEPTSAAALTLLALTTTRRRRNVA